MTFLGKIKIMSRVSAHVIETKATDFIQSKVNGFCANGDSLFRKISERDYGIDAIIELFNNGVPTGQIALVQIKGTENTIVPLKNNEVVSCKISSSNAQYALQTNIPILLFYISISKPMSFYFARIQDVITEDIKRKIKKQKDVTVRIPAENVTADDLTPIFDLIHEYYN